MEGIINPDKCKSNLLHIWQHLNEIYIHMHQYVSQLNLHTNFSLHHKWDVIILLMHFKIQNIYEAAIIEACYSFTLITKLPSTKRNLLLYSSEKKKGFFFIKCLLAKNDEHQNMIHFMLLYFFFKICFTC